MADKTIAIKVELQGTTEQQKKLSKLEAEVKKLTDRRRELNKALKEGTISLDQYGKEIAQVNTRLKGARREMLVTREAVLGLDSFTKKLGKSFARLGTSISGAFVGLFAVQKLFDIVADGIKTIEEFEQQMANVLAVTGATDVEFQALTDSAKELGRTSLFTSTEVGELQEELAKLGFTTPEILAASEAILQLAAASGSELSQSAVVAASTLRGFSLEATETQRVVDVMAKSFSSSSLDINKFQTAMAAVAPVAKTAGFSIEQTTALLGTLTDAGFDASTAGTGLRNIFLEIEKRGITLEEAFNQINNSSDKTTTALELFDKRGAALAITLADNQMKSEDLTHAFNNAQGAAQDMADVMGETSVGATKKLDSAWEGLILTIGEGSEKGFASFKKGLADFLNDVTDFISARDKLLSSGVDLSLGDRYFGLDEDQAENIKLINDQEKFLNENLKNREALLQREAELKAQIKRFTDEEFSDENRRKKAADDLTDAEEDRLNWIRNQRRILQKAAQDLRTQASTLKEINELEEASAETNAINAEIEAKTQVSITEMKLEDLKKLDNEEAKAEIKRRKRIEDENKKILRAEERLSKQIQDLKDQATVLEIENKREAEDKKLELAEAAAVREVNMTIASAKKKEEAISAIEDKFKAQRDALARKRVQEDAKKVKEEEDKKKKKEEEDQKSKDDFDSKLRQKQLDVAEQAANALVSVTNRRVERQKELELAALDAQLENGLITQEEFEKKREAIERKAFNRQKKLEIAQVAISLARELANIAANSAGNPLNAFTGGGAGVAQNLALAKVAVARAAIQTGIIASQQFAEGGYTGDGFGSPDSTGFKPAGVVHEGEYVVPKRVLESQKGGRLVGALESMRLNKPTPLSSIGFANGGFTGGASSMDLTDLENRIAMAVSASMSSIQVVNNATDTLSEAVRVSNIQSEATFG